MNIQIFGTKKCNDTKKAERFFKERSIKYQFIDMKEKGMVLMEQIRIAKSIEDQAGYIKNKGLDDPYYKTLIIEYLKQYSKANRKEIDKLLWDKLPDSLSDDQKKHKVHNLLTALKISILLKRMEKTNEELTGY